MNPRKQIFTGVLLVALALLLLASIPFFSFHFGDEVGAGAEILGIVFFAWGGATLLWAVEKSLRGIGSTMMILIGCFIAVLSALAGSILFAMLGGFMAVIGSLFFLRKRTC